jgi:hypothetical protein
MQFETIHDPPSQDGRAGPDAATTTPYKTQRQGRAGRPGYTPDAPHPAGAA